MGPTGVRAERALPAGIAATGVHLFTASGLLLVLAVASFVPVDYLYPSRTRQLWRTTMALTSLWFVGYAAAVATLPDTPAWLIVATLAYVGYYAAASLVLTVRRRASASVPVSRGLN